MYSEASKYENETANKGTGWNQELRRREPEEIALAMLSEIKAAMANNRTMTITEVSLVGPSSKRQVWCQT